jgi:hypothetical protein
MRLRHAVRIVTGSGGLEFHLDHRVGPRHGRHRVVGEAEFADWIADVGDACLSFQVAATCPCQSGAVASPEPSGASP